MKKDHHLTVRVPADLLALLPKRGRSAYVRAAVRAAANQTTDVSNEKARAEKSNCMNISPY